MNGDTCGHKQADPSNCRQTPAGGGAASAKRQGNRFTPDWEFPQRGRPGVHLVAIQIVHRPARDARKMNLAAAFIAAERLVPEIHHNALFFGLWAYRRHFFWIQRAESLAGSPKDVARSVLFIE